MTGQPRPLAPGTARIRCRIDLTEEELAYFTRCARIRDICTTSLMRRIVRVVLRDQLISSILDDETNLRKRAKGEHRYRGYSAPAG